MWKTDQVTFLSFCIFMELAWKFPLVSNSCYSDELQCKPFDSSKPLKVLYKFCFIQLLKTHIDNSEHKWKKLRSIMTIYKILLDVNLS